MSLKDKFKYLFAFIALAIFTGLNLSGAIWQLYDGNLAVNVGPLNTAFKQSWGFFGPHPVLGNLKLDFKCIYSNKIENWKTFSSELDKLKKPVSSIFPSNNSEYLMESLYWKSIWGVPKSFIRLCHVGNCSALQSHIENRLSFMKTEEIVKDICRSISHSEDELVGYQTRFVLENVVYFSNRKSKKDIYVRDFLEMPTRSI